jgi:GDPmannose 4,6-dehydratase
LGNISIARDWGWSPEYVEAMWLMLQQEKPEDFVIATGETNTLEEFIAEAFRYVGLDWREHVVSDRSLLRPSEIMVSHGNPAKAFHQLGWCAAYKMRDVVRMMIAAERQFGKKTS